MTPLTTASLVSRFLRAIRTVRELFRMVQHSPRVAQEES